MSGILPTSPNLQVFQSMDVQKTRSFTQKNLCSQWIITATPGQPPATRNLCLSVFFMVTRPTRGLFRSHLLQWMVTFGLTISVTGSSTRSTLTSVPRAELRGQERDPRLRGRHQPGEDGRPQGPGERERGDATILPRQLSLLVHIVAYLRSIIVFDITISSIHISKPSTCRSFTTVYRDAYVRDVTRAASVSERAFRRMKMYNWKCTPLNQQRCK